MATALPVNPLVVGSSPTQGATLTTPSLFREGSLEGLHRYRGMEHSARRAAQVSSRSHPPRALRAGAARRGDQFHLPPDAPRIDVPTLGGQRAAQLPLLAENSSQHHP